MKVAEVPHSPTLVGFGHIVPGLQSVLAVREVHHLRDVLVRRLHRDVCNQFHSRPVRAQQVDIEIGIQMQRRHLPAFSHRAPPFQPQHAHGTFLVVVQPPASLGTPRHA